jgi:hypothetical protein
LGTYDVVSAALPMSLVKLDFSNIPSVNNNPNFKIRITFDNIAKGNNRYDNITCEGIPSNLPVVLTSFSGKILNNETKLFFTATNEVNAKSYVIEKGKDINSFSSIATIPAKNSTALVAYEYIDETKLNTIQYYRLKIVDNNGSFTYSKIISIAPLTAFENSLSVFPNPAISNEITIQHPIATKGGQIKLYSNNGKLLSTILPGIGTSKTVANIATFTKGIYLIYYENNGIKTSIDFVK